MNLHNNLLCNLPKELAKLTEINKIDVSKNQIANQFFDILDQLDKKIGNIAKLVIEKSNQEPSETKVPLNMPPMPMEILDRLRMDYENQENSNSNFSNSESHPNIHVSENNHHDESEFSINFDKENWDSNMSFGKIVKSAMELSASRNPSNRPSNVSVLGEKKT